MKRPNMRAGEKIFPTMGKNQNNIQMGKAKTRKEQKRNQIADKQANKTDGRIQPFDGMVIENRQQWIGLMMMRPGQNRVLCHGGKCQIRRQVVTIWQRDIEE